ncbi:MULTISPECIES: phage GP46 family protein [unclassified Saccharibacter]|uniref:phage GP46 family protein n=1 Tax=unclassified Saccharibacter TaxID=2648722 RepID=UPI00132615C3|nr:MULTISPECIES: phage GP46 family protein [unclassified Saccharibacter]MXV35849.1 hypothetical protein [Saccharibacter sp. EH611]MXV57970.1 hypothetical protein [Saccharibacter sp. EH70]MXV66365.1 hypothetical protein [Saccharibacter sp. EH60]
MTRRSFFSTIAVAPNADGRADLVITPTGGGGGRVSFDTTLSSPLLIALSADRRAAPDDVVPPLLTAPTGTATPFGAKRGWVGDVLLTDGQRLGSKLWLLERAKRSEATRLDAEDYAHEAVAAIGAYHNIDLSVEATWQPATAGIVRALTVRVSAGESSAFRKVPTL